MMTEKKPIDKLIEEFKLNKLNKYNDLVEQTQIVHKVIEDSDTDLIEQLEMIQKQDLIEKQNQELIKHLEMIDKQELIHKQEQELILKQDQELIKQLIIIEKQDLIEQELIEKKNKKLIKHLEMIDKQELIKQQQKKQQQINNNTYLNLDNISKGYKGLYHQTDYKSFESIISSNMMKKGVSGFAGGGDLFC